VIGDATVVGGIEHALTSAREAMLAIG